MTDAASTRVAPTRVFYWSVRRELWEHRSIYIGPLIAAGVVLFGFLLSTIKSSHVHMDLDANTSNVRLLALLPYVIVAGVVLGTGLLVAFAYCLSALNTERRDRSILFWKSLPVSDATTVLSKAAVPIVIIPVVAMAVILGSEIVVALLAAIAGFHPAGSSPGDAFSLVLNMLLYGPVVLGLWYAPIYGWLLLISGWAKRGAFLWAILPPLAVCVLEAIVFHSRHFADLLAMRLNGGFAAAFALSAPGLAHHTDLPNISNARFFTSPDLWVGLLVAAAFLAVAVWQRRRAEPT